MAVRTRNASDKFESATPATTPIPEDNELNINITKSFFYKMILIFAMLILFSP